MVVRERDYHLFEEAFGFEIICQAKSLGKSTPRSIEIIMASFFDFFNWEYLSDTNSTVFTNKGQENIMFRLI